MLFGESDYLGAAERRIFVEADAQTGVMTEDMIAYCGLVCTECKAFIAKQTDDNELRASAAAMWGSPEWPMDVADINCDGCKAEGEHFKYCAACLVRTCGHERGVATCAHCSEYVCETLRNWFKMAGTEARDRLERIRTSA
ncbi:MAG: DUF3795 domain-containing protein [Candidatus Thorarchaeota archaeon]|nr:DUF3795 domain-containing protein [Candidatus Thorarchaeota archaeon]